MQPLKGRKRTTDGWRYKKLNVEVAVEVAVEVEVVVEVAVEVAVAVTVEAVVRNAERNPRVSSPRRHCHMLSLSPLLVRFESCVHSREVGFVSSDPAFSVRSDGSVRVEQEQCVAVEDSPASSTFTLAELNMFYLQSVLRACGQLNTEKALRPPGIRPNAEASSSVAEPVGKPHQP
ncbi:LOW QUALITY PROTEIN: hypothetical protein CRUP_007698 [Coryphaenoides rupestris]|nr:LOW QUALITY PROTEIN: hypothetical protein CRUP_007698 [Coryphaenoides rupestris]